MHFTLPARLRPLSGPAARSGAANAAVSLAATGLALAVAGLLRRRRVDRAAEARAEADTCAYEHFVRDFGPAATLTDPQLAALTAYITTRTDQHVPSVVAELLRGRAWNWRDEHDYVDEEQPRVRHITAVVDGLAHCHPEPVDTAAERQPIAASPWDITPWAHAGHQENNARRR